MSAPVIALTNLKHSYGSLPVLDIERMVLPGGTTALLGPNGAGKTSLLQILATVSSPGEGSVVIDGRDIAEPAQRLAVRRELGYMAQHDRLPPRMRVSEYCDYVAALKEIGPRRARLQWTEWALEQADLVGKSHDRLGTLSGGMRRRLMLAQSLLGYPRLVVLDEPLVSLDATHRSSVVRTIAASAHERSTVIATHYADELAAVCQHVVVLVGGQMVFGGQPNELAAKAQGQVWETAMPVDHPTSRALGPDRFRVVGIQPAGAMPAEPTVHDGYLAVVNAALAASH